MKLIIDIPEELAEKEHWYTDKEIWTVIKAAQNGIPLDKIRAEIDRQQKWLLQAGHTAYNVDIAFDAIKSVVAEGSDKE